ncbi:MAG: hypothetical protein JWO36_2900 [Myxococcales bacterium]|nr:hypothetical protein [Myxococcales bacterium]
MKLALLSLCVVTSTRLAVAQSAPDETPVSESPTPATSPPSAPVTAPPPPASAAAAAPSARVQGSAEIHHPVPHTVERGGGAGRMFAWTTMLLGITGGAAAGGLYLYAKHDLDSCEQHTLLGIGCGSQQKSLDDATAFTKLGGIGAGALIGTSILLFVMTDAKHTEVVYDDGHPEPEGLPIGGYAATGIALAGAITAQVIMSNASADLADPARHPTPDDTSSLVSRYHYARYAAGGLYAVTLGFAAMAALDTVRAVRKHARSETSTQVSLSPLSGGAVVSLFGGF